jgi:hypothetical protein
MLGSQSRDSGLSPYTGGGSVPSHVFHTSYMSYMSYVFPRRTAAPLEFRSAW